MSSNAKVAVITGAGSGIGRAVALAFLAEGYSVALAGRRAQPLDETLGAAGEARRNGLAVACDVTDAASVQALFAATRARWGRVDVLFNNAGIAAPSVPLEDVPLATWNAVVATNLTGPFLCTQEAFRIMKSQDPRGGRIINNGSISAHAPRSRSAPYTATKHAMTGLTKSTSLDGRAYDIACGQIDIGNARTELADKMAKASADPEPLMDVEHVAQAVLNMARLPLSANVQFMTIMATKMPYIGRG